jgi:hypothetical protein
MTETMTTPRTATGGVPWRLVVAAAVGAAVAVFFGVYGKVHDPAGQDTITLFFDKTLDVKVAFTTIAVLLAMVQLYTALRIYGKTSLPPRVLPPWFGAVHRLSGTFAFLFSLPVAYHCLWSLGFNSDASQFRPFLHSIVGCFFYGVFAAKMLIVRDHKLPGWALPVVGGAVFTALVTLWLTSALFVFTGSVNG